MILQEVARDVALDRTKWCKGIHVSVDQGLVELSCTYGLFYEIEWEILIKKKKEKEIEWEM